MFKLQGVVPPMITPFDKEGNLDIENLEKLLLFLKERVHGLYICGSYGGGPMMSIEERKKVAETAVKVIDGKIPIIVHTGTTNTRDTIELTKHAESIGCEGASAVGPYYYHHNEDNVLEFYTSMLKAISSDFPIYVYHNPKFSGYEISLNTVKKLKDRGIHGIKDATFDIITFATYMRELADENFYIPMYGMVQSLNVSVSAAITIYEAVRQRLKSGMFNKSELSEAEIKRLMNEWSKK